jgi:hypothetical protein
MAINKPKLKELCERYENLTKYLRSLLDDGASDNEREEDLLPRSYGLDSKGRRLVRPATLKDRKAFEEDQGIAGRRIRVLG